MVVDFLTTTSEALTNPLVSLWVSFVELLPNLIAAIVILIIGYVVAYIIGHALKVMLWKLGLDKQIDQAKLSKAMGKLRLSSILGEITKWYIFLVFLQSAIDLVNLGTLSLLLQEFVMWIPNVIAAALVIIFGLYVAHFITLKVREHTDVRGGRTLTGILNTVIIFIVIVIAMEQIGINVSILTNTFLILLGGLALGAAIAIGISFGLGTQKDAGRALEKIKKWIH
ncbi:MAG: hypothetical protein Q8N77_00250 [Nanoarchaeota archaeon]|nr:hypothetical protein [Nanoarchaeota archaeon]